MSASLIPTPVMQFFGSNGDPLSGGKVYTYAAGTSTPLATYTDQGGATPNANPVILDSRGEAAIWFGDSSYKLILKTSADVLIWTADNVTAALASLAASSGSSLVGFLQAGTGAVARTVQAKERDVVSAKDFGAVGNGVANDTTALQAAITAAAVAGAALYIPAGTYLTSAPMYVPSNSRIYGAGMDQTIIKASAGFVSPNAGGLFMNSSFPASGAALAANSSTTLNTNIVIELLKIDGNNTVNTYGINMAGVSSVTIRNIKTANTAYTGICLQVTEKCNVVGNTCLTPTTNGIQIVDSYRYLIDGNNVVGSGDYAIECDSGYYVNVGGAAATGGATVSNNIVSTFYNYGICCRGLVSATTNPSNFPIQNVTIIGNTVGGGAGGSSSGICVQENCKDIVIDGNVVYANNAVGIVGTPGTGTQTNIHVTDNVVQNCQTYGIQMISPSYFSITGNVITDSYGSAIYTSGQYGTIKNNTTQNNGVGIGSSAGLDLINCNNVYVDGNIFANSNANIVYAIREISGCSAMNYGVNDTGTKTNSLTSWLYPTTVGSPTTAWTQYTYRGNVTTSAVVLFDLFSRSNGGPFIAYVSGKDSTGTQIFFDTIIGCYFAAPGAQSVTSFNVVAGLGRTRTYDLTSNGGNALNLTMSAGTYIVEAKLDIGLPLT